MKLPLYKISFTNYLMTKTIYHRLKIKDSSENLINIEKIDYFFLYTSFKTKELKNLPNFFKQYLNMDSI